MGAHASKQSLYFNESGSVLSSLFQRKNLPDGLELDKSVFVDVSTIDGSYEHDFAEGHSEHAAHESLKRQVANYVLISGS